MAKPKKTKKDGVGRRGYTKRGLPCGSICTKRYRTGPHAGRCSAFRVPKPPRVQELTRKHGGHCPKAKKK